MDDELLGDDGDGEIRYFFKGGLDVGMMFRKNKKGVLRETVWVQYNNTRSWGSSTVIPWPGGREGY